MFTGCTKRIIPIFTTVTADVKLGSVWISKWQPFSGDLPNRAYLLGWHNLSRRAERLCRQNYARILWVKRLWNRWNVDPTSCQLPQITRIGLINSVSGQRCNAATVLLVLRSINRNMKRKASCLKSESELDFCPLCAVVVAISILSTLCRPVNNLPGTLIHGIFGQEYWVSFPFPFSKSSPPRYGLRL